MAKVHGSRVQQKHTGDKLEGSGNVGKGHSKGRGQDEAGSGSTQFVV